MFCSGRTLETTSCCYYKGGTVKRASCERHLTTHSILGLNVLCVRACVYFIGLYLYCAVLVLFQEIYSIHSFIHCFQHYSRPFCSPISKYLSQFIKLNFFLPRSTASHSTVLQCRRVVRYHLHNCILKFNLNSKVRFVCNIVC